MVQLYDVEQGGAVWHELRRGKWTGSRAIKLLTGKKLTDDSSPFQSAAMRRGKVLEPIAIREFERETGIDVFTTGFVINSKFKNAGYSPDGVIGETLLEVKCLNNDRHEELRKGNIPLEYLAQIYFGMVICELKNAKLLAFNPEFSKQLTIIDVPYNRTIGKNIKDKLKSASSS